MSSLRWRLLAVTLLAVFLPVWWMQREAVRYFDGFSGPAQERHMREMAAITGELLRRMPQDLPGEWIRLDETLRPLSARHGIFFQVYDRAGALRIDTTSESPVALTTNKVAATVAVARTGRYKAAWELSPDNKYLWYHCAEPVKQDDQVEGVILLSRHTNPIIQAIKRMQANQQTAMLLSLGLGAAAAGLLAWTRTRRLRRLASRAAEVAGGRTQTLEPLTGRDEIAGLSRAFATMTAELGRRNRYNRDFVSSTLHELKAPLTAIRGAAEILQQGAADRPEAREKFLRNILHESDRMSRLVEELNQLTRVDAEAASAPRAPVDLCALARGIAERADLAFEPPRAVLSTAVPAEPLVVNAHAPQMEQVVLNLLDNAFRYTPVTGEVRLSVRAAGDRVELEVADNGPGIAPSNLPKIFDRFFTTEPKGLNREYGSGLGLAIAKAIIEGHGGVISAASEPGRGAVFTVSLPRR
ncbi:MAG: HAMP domain-containing sensor histidine kinase [Kiritimatiellia bacterium]